MRIASDLASSYTQGQPFHLWLSEIFRQQKQFGSKDRRFYREALYAGLRLGDWGTSLPPMVRLACGWIRQNPDDGEMREWLSMQTGLPVDGISFEALCDHFREAWNPYGKFAAQLDPALDPAELNDWFGHIPQVWIRVTAGKESNMADWLNRHSIPFTRHDRAWCLPPAVPVDECVKAGWCRIQDAGSQMCITTNDVSDDDIIWDCCCGAGGKSLLLKELAPEAGLYISDSRPAIVDNALSRFRLAGWPEPHAGVNDLSRKQDQIVFENRLAFSVPVFDLIVCDVPCSGSGTWRRNPEQLLNFREAQIEEYAGRQQKIVMNALPFLKKGGRLIYLTCSVFHTENGQNVALMAQNCGLNVLEQGIAGGKSVNGDYLYRAVLEK